MKIVIIYITKSSRQTSGGSRRGEQSSHFLSLFLIIDEIKERGEGDKAESAGGKKT